MNKELILKLLAALGVKIGTNDGEMKEEDAIKLVEDSFNAGNAGLINKRDELLKQEKDLKAKIEGLETIAKETGVKQTELEAQLKKADPEKFKAYYEGLAKDAETKHTAELENKFPTPEMLERIAGALEMDSPQLFSMASFSMEVISQFQKEVMSDLEGIVSNVFTTRLNDLEKNGKI
jgi:DNA-binding phage protein